MDDVLQQQGLQQYTEADVRRVVEENNKQRFKLDIDVESSRLKIRANQGHTVEVSRHDVMKCWLRQARHYERSDIHE